MRQEKEAKIDLKYTLMIHSDSLESLEHVDIFTSRTAKDYESSQRLTDNHSS